MMTPFHAADSTSTLLYGCNRVTMIRIHIIMMSLGVALSQAKPHCAGSTQVTFICLSSPHWYPDAFPHAGRIVNFFSMLSPRQR